jgi:hypothetical protein
MRRYQPPEPNDALPDELQRIWDELRRLHEAMARAILPYGYEFDVADDGSIRIVQNGSVVGITANVDVDLGDVLTINDIEAICEECGSVEGPVGPPGPPGPAGADEFIEHAKWMVD